MSKAYSLMWVGLIQSTEGLSRSKRLALPWVGQNPFCLAVYSWDVMLFSVFCLKLKHLFFLSSKLPAFRLELQHQFFLIYSLSSLGSHDLTVPIHYTTRTIVYFYIHLLKDIFVASNLTIMNKAAITSVHRFFVWM